MKKILLSLVIVLSILGSAIAQPNVSFRMNNPQVIDCGGGSLALRFDVDIKADAAGYYIFGGQANIDINALGLDISGASSPYVTPGTLLQGMYDPPGAPPPTLKYGITYNSNSGRLNMSIDPIFFGNAAYYPVAYEEFPTAWTQCWIVQVDILDEFLEAGLVFNEISMNNNMTYALATGLGALCISPNLYYDEMADLYLGRVYCDAHGWTPSAPAAGETTMNASIWDGEAEITAGQSSAAVQNNVRIHDHSGPTGTVGEASLAIVPGAGLTVLGDLENPIEDGVQVQSVETGTGSLIPGTISGAGTYRVDRYLSAAPVSGTDYYFHQVAAPVDNQVLQDFDVIPGSSYAFQFNGTAASGEEWENIYAYTRPTPLGYGFILSTINSVAAQTKEFSDDIHITDLDGVGIAGTSGQFSLIGNPYPSPISYDAFYTTQGAGVIAGATYIWDASDDGSGNYMTYTQSSGATGNQSCRFIQVGQSFFVESTGGSSVDFKTTHRVHNDQAFLKDEPVNTMRLYTIGGESTWDELYINFRDNADATGGFDVQLDAQKWASAYGEIATEIYTTATDGSNLSIDVRPPIGDDMISIPLSFKAGSEANYSFGTEMIESFDSDIEIFLEDLNFPGAEWFDMRAGEDYAFSAAPSDEYDRFIIHFYPKSFGIDDMNIDPVSIYSHRTDAIIVNDSEQRIKEILIYDIMGNLLVDKVAVNASPIRMYISDKVGYYVVKVITDKAVYSEKVFISK